MAKKPEAPVPAPVTFTLALTKPITKDGARIDSLVLEEPELRHFVVAARKGSGQASTIALIAQISGLTEDEATRIKTRDARAIEKWMRDLRASVSDGDADIDDGRRFVLLSPLEGPPRLEAMTLREPDLGSGVAVEKFKTEAEQSAALLAALSDTTIPTVNRLKLRDLARMEAWVFPLLDAAG